MFARVVIWLIRLYQRSVSRLVPSMCRFTPSCSHYAIRALQVHGFWRGLYLSCRRIGRCHPLSRGGHDPVPGDPELLQIGAQPKPDQDRSMERQ